MKYLRAAILAIAMLAIAAPALADTQPGPWPRHPGQTPTGVEWTRR